MFTNYKRSPTDPKPPSKKRVVFTDSSPAPPQRHLFRALAGLDSACYFPPPPPLLLFASFAGLGTVLSFLVGRTPGELPRNPTLELALPTAVACGYVSTYVVFDALGCGRVKGRHGLVTLPLSLWPTPVPEEVLVAEAAQRNQLEHLPPFVVSMLCFSVFVNGVWAGVIGLGWAVLRRVYAAKYRAAIGLSLVESSVQKLAIPSYFLVNAMLWGTMVHLGRAVVANNAG